MNDEREVLRDEQLISGEDEYIARIDEPIIPADEFWNSSENVDLDH